MATVSEQQVTVTVRVDSTSVPARPVTPAGPQPGLLPITGLVGGMALLLFAVLLVCLGAALLRAAQRPNRREEPACAG